MRILGTIALVGALLVGAPACAPSCEGLTATEQDREAASNNYEVEKEGKYGSTCELQPDGSWEVDD